MTSPGTDEPVVMEHPIILFDGVCNLCNGCVNWVLRHDKKRVFRFAALQSEAGQRIAQDLKCQGEIPESIILIEDNRVNAKSRAILGIIRRLPLPFKFMYGSVIVPRFLRDPIYNLIARNRYRWFGKKQNCMIPSEDALDRFLF